MSSVWNYAVDKVLCALKVAVSVLSHLVAVLHSQVIHSCNEVSSVYYSSRPASYRTSSKEARVCGGGSGRFQKLAPFTNLPLAESRTFANRHQFDDEARLRLGRGIAVRGYA